MAIIKVSGLIIFGLIATFAIDGFTFQPAGDRHTERNEYCETLENDAVATLRPVESDRCDLWQAQKEMTDVVGGVD